MCKSVNVLDTDKCNVQFTMYKVQIGCAVVFLDTDYTDECKVQFTIYKVQLIKDRNADDTDFLLKL